MKPRTSRLLSRLAPIWAALLATVSATVILRRALAPGRSLASPDSQPLINVFWKAQIPLNILGERCEIPSYDTFLALLFSPGTYCVVGYIAAAAVTAFATALYLRRWRLPAAASVFGGLALAFCGYHFTLFSAGHRGYALMIPHAILLLAAIDGMVDGGRWPWFVLGAVFAICGFRNQPDVFFLLSGVFALYAVLRVALRWRRCARDARRAMLTRWGTGAAVFVAVALLFGGPALWYTATNLVAGRESQIKQAAGGGEASDEDAALVRWDFTTSWSLPPAELPELACANLRGYDSGNRDGPYWGSLGRNVHYDENGGQGFFNFRQHTLYLGALTLVFALLGVLGALTPKARTEDADGTSAASDDATAVIVFWCAAAFISLVLAMGRYTPFYRLFYALPKMSSIRGPVKFLHITELSLALLSGFGVARLQAALGAAAPRRRALTICAGVAGLAALALLSATLVDPTGIDRALSALGIPADSASGSAFRTFSTILVGLRLRTLLATAAVFGFGALALLFTAFAGPVARRRGAVVLPAALCIALLIDMGRAAAPYVNPIDASLRGQPNALVESLRASGQLDGSRWGGTVPGVTDQQVVRDAFGQYGFPCSDPYPGDDPTIDTVEVARLFRDAPSPFRRWQFWGTRVVLVPLDGYAELPSSTAQFAKLGTFAYQRGAIVRTEPERAHFGAIALRNWLPSAAVFPVWEFAPDATAAWARIVDPELDLSRAAVLEEAPACTARPDDAASVPAKETTTLHDGRYRRMAFETAERSPAGMLVVRDAFRNYSDIRARVDGQPAPVYVANRYSRAVPVPAGRHAVELYLPLSGTRMVAYGATLLLALAAVWSLARQSKDIARARLR